LSQFLSYLGLAIRLELNRKLIAADHGPFADDVIATMLKEFKEKRAASVWPR